jgi:hypothetical protein
MTIDKKGSAMKKSVMAIALVMLPCIVFGATLPEPMLTVPHDTIFTGRLLDTLWCPHDSGTVYYTTNGSNPTTMGPFVGAGYRWPFSFDSTVTLKAFSWWRMESGEVLHSDTITVKYTKKLSPPINYQAPGTFIDSIKIEFAKPETGATIHYTTDGTMPDSTSTIYTLPIVFKETTTLNYMATKRNCLPSDILTRTYEKMPVSALNRQMALHECNTLKVIASYRSKSNMVLNFTLTQPEDVFITINDFSGRSITTIVNKRYGKGIHDYSWPIHGISAGIYFVKMETSTGNLIKRVSLVR